MYFYVCLASYLLLIKLINPLLRTIHQSGQKFVDNFLNFLIYFFGVFFVPTPLNTLVKHSFNKCLLF